MCASVCGSVHEKRERTKCYGCVYYVLSRNTDSTMHADDRIKRISMKIDYMYCIMIFIHYAIYSICMQCMAYVLYVAARHICKCEYVRQWRGLGSGALATNLHSLSMGC